MRVIDKKPNHADISLEVHGNNGKIARVYNYGTTWKIIWPNGSHKNGLKEYPDVLEKLVSKGY